MNRLLPLVVFAVCTAVSIPAKAQQSDPLRVVRTMELPGAVKGSLGHLAADPATHRLFVTAEDEQAILVVDLSSGTVTHQITGVAKPRAVLYRADQNRIYVTDGADGTVRIFDGTTYQALNTVSLAKDAGSIGYDASRQLLYVVNDSQAAGNKFSQLSIVDSASASKIADITIDGDTLEEMALDVFRPRMYVNNAARNRIDVIDRWKAEVVASWPVALCKDNVAVALDEQRQRLFVGCRSGKISIFDSNTGKELQALTTPNGTQGLAYDPDAKRLYAGGDGAVSVYEQTDADHYKLMGNTQTGAGARAAVLVPALNRYFVAVPRGNSKSAAILEMEPAGAAPTRAGDPPVSVKLEAPAGQQLLLATMSAHPYLRKLGIHAIPPAAVTA